MMADQERGFSLVELVVVVAIMAALVGILAPAYLAYVEKTRIQRDESAADEIFRAAEIVVYAGEYDVTEQVLVTFNSQGIQLNSQLANAQEFENMMKDHFGDQYNTAAPVSKKYRNQTYTVTILPPEEEQSVPHLAGSWS